MPVTATAIVTTQAKHPQVSEIQDVAAQQSIRLLWDTLQTTRDQLTAAQGTIASLVSQINSLETQVQTNQRGVEQALTIAQQP